MVQGQVVKIGWEVSLRVASVAGAFLLTLFFYGFFTWIISLLGYHVPTNSYTSFNFFTEPEIIFGLIFWGSMFFSLIGTRFDYAIVALFFVYGVFTYFAMPNPFNMIVGLALALSIGGAIGYFLRSLRRKDRSISYPDANSLKYKLLTRSAVLVGTFILAIWTSGFFTEIVTETLNYQEPPTFFGFLQGLTTMLLGLVLGWLFWCSVAFSSLGKRIDYAFSGLLFVFVMWFFSTSGDDTRLMYLGVVSVALLGNALGYMLKVGKERWLK